MVNITNKFKNFKNNKLNLSHIEDCPLTQWLEEREAEIKGKSGLAFAVAENKIRKEMVARDDWFPQYSYMAIKEVWNYDEPRKTLALITFITDIVESDHEKAEWWIKSILAKDYLNKNKDVIPQGFKRRLFDRIAEIAASKGKDALDENKFIKVKRT